MEIKDELKIKSRKCWDILTNLARNQQSESIEKISEELDTEQETVISILAQVSTYCKNNKFPDITILVDITEGMDKDGIPVKYRELIRMEYFWLFDFEWEKIKNPF